MATLAGVWGRREDVLPRRPVEEPKELLPLATVITFDEVLKMLLGDWPTATVLDILLDSLIAVEEPFLLNSITVDSLSFRGETLHPFLSFQFDSRLVTAMPLLSSSSLIMEQTELFGLRLLSTSSAAGIMSTNSSFSSLSSSGKDSGSTSVFSFVIFR